MPSDFNDEQPDKPMATITNAESPLAPRRLVHQFFIRAAPMPAKSAPLVHRPLTRHSIIYNFNWGAIRF